MLDLRKLNLTEANQAHERSEIRHLRPTDCSDLERLWEIETDKMVGKFLSGPMSENDEDMAEFMSANKNYLVLAVSGKSGHVDDDEVGKLQGWITIYNDEKKRLNRLAKKGFDFLVDKTKRILEIGFARHPRAKSGQMASALRQLLQVLHSEHKKDGSHEVIVTAYASEDNEASMRVLVAAGFEKLSMVKYSPSDKGLDHFFVWRAK